MNKICIRWDTGDIDQCCGFADLMNLLDGLGYVLVGRNVMDGDRICGRLVRDDEE